MNIPVGSYLKIVVANSYDAAEYIATKVSLTPLVPSGTATIHMLTKTDMANGTEIFPLDAGKWRVAIEPLPPFGQQNGPKKWGSDMQKEIDLDGHSATTVKFEIKRKQAMLYNIPMTYKVAANKDADGTAPIYEVHMVNDVIDNAGAIYRESKAQGVDENLVKAIMYMETTHGYYDAAPALVDKNKSILPMNVRSDYWAELGWSRSELKKTATNIKAGVFILKRLVDRVRPFSVARVATLYNSLGETKVLDYGARVAKIYDNKLWLQSKSTFHDIRDEARRFNNLSEYQKLWYLRRLFGG